MTSIPQDVIDSIIDLLSTSDNDNSDTSIAALRACALACTSFLFTVRRYRFRKLVVKVYGYGAHTTSEQAKKLQDLLDILQTDPFQHSVHSVSNQIRSLCFSFNVVRKNTNLMEHTLQFDQTIGAEQQASILQSFHDDMQLHQLTIPALTDVRPDPNLVPIIKMLSSVQYLECLFPRGTVLWTWPLLDEAVRSAIFKQACCPTVTSLHFGNIGDFPTDIIAKCQNLRSLRLHHVKASIAACELGLSSTVDADTSEASPPQIRDLHATSSSSTFGWLLGLPTPSHLVSLRVSMSLVKEEMLITWRLIQSSVNLLERLTLENIHPVDYFIKFGYVFDLSLCRNLRHLRLLGNMQLVVKPQRFSIAMLIDQLIANTAAPTSIETIQIDLQFGMMVQGTEKISFSQWTQLDAALNSASFPCLRSVDIDFSGIYMWIGQGVAQTKSEITKMAEAEIQQCVRDALPTILSTKTLNITFRIEVDLSTLQDMVSSGYYATFMQNLSS